MVGGKRERKREGEGEADGVVPRSSQVGSVQIESLANSLRIGRACNPITRAVKAAKIEATSRLEQRRTGEGGGEDARTDRPLGVSSSPLKEKRLRQVL